MILERKSDKKGAYYRLGMIERSSLTLENYAASRFGGRFYSDDFLRGFCERRNEVHAKVTKASSALVIVTTLLAFLNNIEGEIHISGTSFSIPQTGAAALSVLVSVNLIAAVNAFLDQLTIDRYLNVLGNRIGVYSFELLLLNYTAQNIHLSGVAPKFFGLVSDGAHKYLQAVFGLFYLVLGGAFLGYPVVMVFSYASAALASGAEIIEIILFSLALSFISFALLNVLSFCFGYKFRPTGTAEPTDPIIPEDFLDHGHPFRSDGQDEDPGGRPDRSEDLESDAEDERA